jgi:hypothetical protein
MVPGAEPRFRYERLSAWAFSHSTNFPYPQPYANILSASPMPRGMEAPDQVNANSIIDVASTPFEETEALPDFIKDKMKSSEEYRGRIVHQENMSGARGNRPARIDAELAADEKLSPEDEAALAAADDPNS